MNGSSGRRPRIRRLALINPPRFVGLQPNAYWEGVPPYSLLCLADYARRHCKVEVEILDLTTPELERSRAALRQTIANVSADIVGVTGSTHYRHQAVDVCRTVRETHPEAVLVVGGPHFGNCIEDTLRAVPEIDYVVQGEGELTLARLINTLQAGTPQPNSIPGLFALEHGQLVGRPPDDSSFVAPEEINLFNADPKLYTCRLIDWPEDVPAFSTIASRGCPAACIFCSKAGTKYRLSRPSRVVDDIIRMRDATGLRAVNFLDLTLTANPAYVRALCREMIDRKAGVRWWCESRANINLDLLPLMREAGCVSSAVGFESASPKILQVIGKSIRAEQVYAFCDRAREIGLRVKVFFVVSFPEETMDDALETMDAILRVRQLGAQVALNRCIIYPGTVIERMAREKRIIPHDFSWYAKRKDGDGLPWHSIYPDLPCYREHLTAEQIEYLTSLLPKSEHLTRQIHDDMQLAGPGSVRDELQALLLRLQETFRDFDEVRREINEIHDILAVRRLPWQEKLARLWSLTPDKRRRYLSFKFLSRYFGSGR